MSEYQFNIGYSDAQSVFIAVATVYNENDVQCVKELFQEIYENNKIVMVKEKIRD